MAEEGGVIEEEKIGSPFAVTADEECPDDFVRACVIFPKLKKKTFKNEAANAEIDIKFESRSFLLTVTMTTEENKKKSKKKMQYGIKQLPDEIVPEKCYHKVKKDQVVLYLAKAKTRSWARELSETGLETLEDEDEKP